MGKQIVNCYPKLIVVAKLVKHTYIIILIITKHCADGEFTYNQIIKYRTKPQHLKTTMCRIFALSKNIMNLYFSTIYDEKSLRNVDSHKTFSVVDMIFFPQPLSLDKLLQFFFYQVTKNLNRRNEACARPSYMT